MAELLKVEIYKEEKVKPLSPTPEPLRFYKFSILDQLYGIMYMPVVFFYGSSGGSHPRHDYDKLKESLSKTLSVWYPLAGRRKDGLTIECNDEGADLVRANVSNCDLVEVLRYPRQHLLRQLFPRNPYPATIDPTQPMLAIQINRFRCGGTAIAICLWHGLADGAGLAGFVRTWAAINRGEGPSNFPQGSVVANTTAIFSPMNMDDIAKLMPSSATQRKMARRQYIAKRFIFPKEEIERLKDKYNQPEYHRRPTQVEVLSAFIWAAVIKATLKANQDFKNHFLVNMVDLRTRMNPPFHPTCLGNIFLLSSAQWEADGGGGKKAETAIDVRSLVGRIREAVWKVTDDHVRKLFAEGGILKLLIAGRKGAEDTSVNKVLSISTWFKFECLKVDFGWGNPVWLGPGNNLEDLALLLDATDGGIEAWIGLPPQVMCNLDADIEFLQHVSFSQIVCEPHSFPPARL